MKKYFLLVCVIIAVIGGAAWAYSRSKPRDGVVFGFVGPLTGDVAPYGLTERIAAEIAVDDINAQGGVDGARLKIVFEDGKCDGKQAATAAQKLLAIDQVNIILGGACSGETLAMIPITESQNVLLFSSFSTAADISQQGNLVFRNAPLDTLGAESFARYIIRHHSQISVIVEQTEYAVGLAKLFRTEFENIGGSILSTEYFITDESDFRTIVQKVLTGTPAAIYTIPQSGKTGGMMVNQLVSAGFQGQLYSTTVFSGQDALSIAGKNAEGIIFNDPPGLAQTHAGAKKFFDEFVQRSHGRKPESEYEAAARYDSVHILAHAIEQVGLDTHAIADFLYALPEWHGILGSYRFDQNGDIIGLRYGIKEIRDGVPVVVE